MANQSEKETARVRDDALKRAFSMPHKPHKSLAKKKPARKPKPAK